jgi:hypothetical protein
MSPAAESLPLALRYEFKGLTEVLRWRLQHGLLPRHPETVEGALRLWLKSRGLKRLAPAVIGALAREVLEVAP